MIAFGIMTLTMDCENNYFNEIAVRSATLGMECFRFIPSQINPLTHKLKGKNLILKAVVG